MFGRFITKKGCTSIIVFIIVIFDLIELDDRLIQNNLTTKGCSEIGSNQLVGANPKDRYDATRAL